MNLRDKLNKFGKETVDEIVSVIERKGIIDTGTLRDSIAYRVVERGERSTVYFTMIAYGKYVDDGTRYMRARPFFRYVINYRRKLLKELIKDEVRKKALEQIKASIRTYTRKTTR